MFAALIDSRMTVMTWQAAMRDEPIPRRKR
jgi:hypothetical protein